MEELKEKTEDLVDHAEELAETFYRLSVVNVTLKASKLVSNAVVVILSCVLGFFILLFLGLALAWWLGTLIESRAGGFLLAAAFFLLIIVCINFFKKKTILPFLKNLIVRQLYD
jgi:hypothetical protein